MEVLLVPVPPLPFFRSPRDNDALAGRGGLASGARTPVTRIGSTGAREMGPGSAPDAIDSPVMLVDDGRSALTVLNEARDHADRIATNLDQLEQATTGVAGVAKLLGRLKDIAVVASSRDVEPPKRAVLQRTLDQALAEIDTLANGTLVDPNQVRSSVRTVRSTSQQGQSAAGATLTPFRQIGTAALGLDDIAVRSVDQAIAAAGALDLASERLERVSDSLKRATARLEDELAGVTSPPVTATGELALGNTTAAFGSTIGLRSDLLANPVGATRAQSSLAVARVFRLLDSASK
jgi:flagellin-like hook-associated protein FlgL